MLITGAGLPLTIVIIKTLLKSLWDTQDVLTWWLNWAKSWLWGDTRHMTSLKQAIRPFVSEELIQRLTHCKDLGCPMAYTGPVRLGHLGKKFETARKKFFLLQNLHRPISVKGQVATGSVYAATFFGSWTCADWHEPLGPVQKSCSKCWS